ncbi:MAG: DUF1385 domain-containing protein [Lachnospirales bacterium]
MENKKKCPVGGKGIGGQAVIEGVMMRGKKLYALAVRTPKKEIVVEKTPIKPAAEKCKILGWPIIRGVVAFVDSLVMGMKVTTKSATLAGLDDIEYDQESKFEKWLESKFGDKLADYLIYFSVAISIILCIGIFMVLPTFLGGAVTNLLHGDATLRSVIEGVIKIIIFVGYMFLVSQMKDIKRVFMYHGAEHKTINCFESGEELTVENVRHNTRFHKRCGTSFLVIVMLVSIILFFFIRTDVLWLRVLSRIILVPAIAGISYEFIRYAGKHDNWLVNIISAPGIAMQIITTSEPDDSMIEVAIASLNAVLEEEPEENANS